MEIPKIEDVVKEPDQWIVRWDEPWPGLDADLEEMTTIHVELRTSVREAIQIQRYSRYMREVDEIHHSDRDLLLNFCVVHWAELIRKEDACAG